MVDRKVANLTTEQLYKKRAYDRRNQRDSRARKKNRIAELEGENSELKQKLKDADVEIDRLKETEQRLLKIVATAQSLLTGLDSGGNAESPGPATPARHEAATYPTATSPRSSTPSTKADNNAHNLPSPEPSLQSTHGTSSTGDDAIGKASTLASNLDLNGREADFSDDTFDLWSRALEGVTDPNSGLSIQFPDPFESNSAPSSPLDTSWMDETASPSTLPIWSRTPTHTTPSCPLDQLVHDQIKLGRQQQASQEELSKAQFPSISSLLNPSELKKDDNPVTKAIGEHVRFRMHARKLSVRIGTTLNLCMLTRWLMVPSKRNYEAIPDYLRPTELQLSMPHPFWIDMIAWPHVRDRTLREMDWTRFFELRQVVGDTAMCNWSNDPSTIFEFVSNKEWKLRPEFIRHIYNGDNWSIGPEVFAKFPEYAGANIFESHPSGFRQPRT